MYRDDFDNALDSVRDGFVVYAHVALCDYRIDPDFGEPTYWEGNVALYGARELDDEPVQSRDKLVGFVLDRGEFTRTVGHNRPEVGDIVSFGRDEHNSFEILEPTKNMVDTYDGVLKARDNAPYEVTIRDYAEEPNYFDFDKDHEWPNYQEIEGSERKFIAPNAHSLEDATKWLLTNYPGNYMGASIVQHVRSGDFMATAVPGTSYPEGTYETQAKREAYGRMIGQKDYGINYDIDKSVDGMDKKSSSSRRLPRGFEDYEGSNDSLEKGNSFDLA